MGFFSNLFKSGAERRKEQDRARRKALREAERASGVVRGKINSLKKDRDAAWAEAREYLKNGQKVAAQRSLQTVQASEVMIGKLERKSWVFSQYTTKLEIAKTDQDFAAALGNLNAIMNIDPDMINDVLADVDDKIADQEDVDKIWDAQYERDMNGIAMNDTIPTVDEMMSNLEREVVGIVSPGQGTTAASGDLAAEINAGRKNLRELLEGKEK